MSEPDGPFADDPILHARVARLINDYGIKCVIETGTWKGFTTRALAGMCEQVYTIEADEGFHRASAESLKDLANVDCIRGDSAKELADLLPTAAPTLYFLDAHWGGTPLLKELEIIAANDPAPIIVIHDFKVPNHPELKFDTYNGQPYEFAWVRPQLDKIKTPWRHFYNSETGGPFSVGVLFVVPQQVAAAPALSLMVCTLTRREALFARLMERLDPQCDPAQVEILVDTDDGEVPTGTKRNRLLARARGDYVCCIDDDDLVPESYADDILHAIESKPDCVGFYIRRCRDGVPDGIATHSIACRSWETQQLDGCTHWLRTPNHVNPIKRHIAQACMFPEKYIGEDAGYADRVVHHLKEEVFIEKIEYEYLFVSKQNRNGI